MNPDSNHKLNKTVVVAAALNILGIISIMLPIIKFSPLTLISSVSLSAIFISVSILAYVYVVIKDIKDKGVL